MSVQARKEEERLKRVDPTKAAQVERLGMGFGGKWGTSVIFKEFSRLMFLPPHWFIDIMGLA